MQEGTRLSLLPDTLDIGENLEGEKQNKTFIMGTEEVVRYIFKYCKASVWLANTFCAEDEWQLNSSANICRFWNLDSSGCLLVNRQLTRRMIGFARVAAVALEEIVVSSLVKLQVFQEYNFCLGGNLYIFKWCRWSPDPETYVQQSEEGCFSAPRWHALRNVLIDSKVRAGRWYTSHCRPVSTCEQLCFEW